MRSRQASLSSIPGFLWRYALAWAIVFGAFLAVIFVRAVVLQLPGEYFTALLWACVAFGFGAFVLEQVYEELLPGHDPCAAGEAELATKAMILAALTVVGAIPVGLAMTLLLLASSVWAPAAPSAGPGGPTPAPPGELTAPAAPAFKEPPPAQRFPGLIAYWPFDEGAGAHAADASGNGHHGRVIGSRWVEGVRGKALRFERPDDYFDYGASPDFNFAARAPFTFAGWIQTRAGQGAIVSQRNRNDGGADVEIALRAGHPFALVRQDGGEWGQPAQVVGPFVADGAWHHFALTRNAGNRIALFVDGRWRGTAVGAHAGGAITTDLRAVGREQYWLLVRRIGHPHWDGALDELAIFNRALSAEEIASLAGR